MSGGPRLLFTDRWQRRMTGILTNLKRRLRIDVLRETGRQYPFFCFLVLTLMSLTVLLNR